MTDLALAQPIEKEASPTLFIVTALIAVVVVVAAVYQFGFPLLITLADLAALTGVALIVVLTALDLKGGSKTRKR